MSEITVVIPLYRQPNFLAQAIEGLVSRSVTNPEILVVWADTERTKEAFPHRAEWDNPCRDFVVGPDDARRTHYASIQDYIARRGAWAMANGVTFYDSTDECIAVRKAAGDFVDGCDIAVKNNIGNRMVTTPYIVPNYDADFYPSRGWDAELLALAESAPGKGAFIPVHVQPRTDYDPPADIEETRRIACNVLSWGVPHDHCHVTRDDWDSLVESLRSDRRISEPCGVRRDLHYLPMLFRTEEFKAAGDYSMIGTGYEVEMDDRLGRLGFMKHSNYRAFNLHKGFIRYPDLSAV